ncbi:hypothetical protein [Mycobacterium sp. 852002-51961_SCH5331710]|uniref:hypothetical protein n=1 Tax=Mycobacterium sp. 852002-51961_SCH5331710 TaxID=1834105 RepID=UPI000A7FD159|nr:hypothetical protein [Mycobacterium sp. 852002-51961_SCH5331710]
MSLDTTGPTWGAPEPRQPQWGRRQTVLAVGVAAVIAALGGAAIYAATDGGSPPGVPAFHGMPAGPPGLKPGPWSNGGPPGVDPAPEVHGEFVLEEGAGGFTTVLTQTGTVTATSPGTVTVRSADGFTQTYSTRADDQPAAINDTVTVRGTRTDGTPTATSISTQRN